MTRISRIVALAWIGLGAPALATPTEVTVRVIARDAKFFGQSMGSARVTLRPLNRFQQSSRVKPR